MTGETPAVHEALAVYAPETTEAERLPEGYRQTEVGVIPEDWEVNRLQDLAPLQRGFDLPNAMLKKGSYPVAYSNGVLNYHNDFRARGPGVVTGRSGTIGKVNYIEEDYWPHNTALWVTDFKGNDPKFVYYLYSSIGLDRFGTGSGVPTLNRNDVHAFSVALPPLHEQRTIAAALSDVDALISALDELIAKKRAVKTAAMQQLLTGKQRLPVFSGEWEVKRLGDMASFSKGSGLSKNDLSPDGNRKCIHYGELFTGYGERIEEVRNGTNKTGSFFLSKRNDVLMPTSDVTPNGLATASCILCSDIILGSDILVIRAPESLLNGEFLAHAIKKNRNQITQLVSGTTVSHLYGRDMADFTFPVPSVEEQTAIAAVLSDMDAEIEALEARREKTRQVKRGMMQELLTGRTRLV
jgi:type I restriction enzyme S subunit